MDEAVVLTCGLTTLDVVQTVERVPGPDEKIVALDVAVAAGGPAAVAAVVCAALGVPARLVTRVGSGILAQAVLGDLHAHGVQVVRADTDVQIALPVSTVLLTRSTGERAVVSVNATAVDRARDDHDQAGDPDATPVDDAAVEAAGATLPRGLWNDVVVLLLDGHHLDLALALARAARERGVPVVLDGGSWKPGLEMLLPLVDVAVLSADFSVPEAVAATAAPGSTPGDAITTTRRLGPRIVAQSHGGEPIVVAGDVGRFMVPVPHVEVMDTLGAGDTLHGALVAWWAAQVRSGATPALGDGVIWADGLAWAGRVASASCTAPGRAWLDDVEHWRADIAGR